MKLEAFGHQRPVLLISILALVSFVQRLNAQEVDQRDIRNAVSVLPDEGYCDQPYVLKTAAGTWLCVLTTGPGTESKPGQHVVAAISSDEGKTWSDLIDIEPTDAIISSWATPYMTSYGRIYVFYNYNGDKIDSMNGHSIHAVALLGWYCFKYSDDNGRTWSKRYRIPIRKTTVDYLNEWRGDVQLFWGISKPVTLGDAMVLSFTKMGRYPQELSEGWLVRSSNINAERNPDKLLWELLPEGGNGIRHTAMGPVQEEHNIVSLNDGSLYCVFRTNEGFPAETYSRDGGETWSTPRYVTYANGGTELKNPRACPRVFKTENGRYLLWYHNHNKVERWQYRNPAWISGGIERDGIIDWSQPEILLYDRDSTERMSYPDLIESNGQYWITETQKEIARIHRIDSGLLNGVWSQHEARNVVSKGRSLDQHNPEGKVVFDTGSLRFKKGLTIDLWLGFESLKPGSLLLDGRDAEGKGFWISVSDRRTLVFSIANGSARQHWDTDPGALQAGTPQHVVFILDAPAGILHSVVNGKQSDGGKYREFGWTWITFDDSYQPMADNISFGKSWGGVLYHSRIYNRPLRVSEAISNHNAGIFTALYGNNEINK